MKTKGIMMKRAWSILLTAALLISMCSMPIVTVYAAEEEAKATEVTCTCETDDPAFHATNCPAYEAPENPQCTCVEKCTVDSYNEWCDVCGFDITRCGGEDTATAYTEQNNCGADGDNVQWQFDDNTGTLTIWGTGKMQNWASYGSVPWFSHHASIQTIIIENGVMSIGNAAFNNCTGLKRVTIPSSVESIGNDAFCNCNVLTSVSIPNSVTSIGNSVFYDCSSLTSMAIPNSVTSIGEKAFFQCNGLKSVEIPGSVKSIGKSAFYGCSGLMSVTIPDSVTSIGSGAFDGCSGLTSVTISDSVTSIGANAFYGCSGLTSVTIPKSVKSIDEYAFGDCSGLESVTIPNSVESIGKDAFSNCSNLTSVTIPGSVTSIGRYAFYKCSGLTSVTIPGSVTSIGDSAFSGCSGLMSVTIGKSVEIIGGSAFSNCSNLTSVNIPDSVTSIGEYAFNNCRGLTSVTIGNSVESIGRSAFGYCSNLTSVNAPCKYTRLGQELYNGRTLLYSFADGVEVNVAPHSADINTGNCVCGYNPIRSVTISGKLSWTYDSEAGTTLTANVSLASDYTPISQTYAWVKGATPVDGATNSNLNISGLNVGAHGYSCTVNVDGFKQQAGAAISVFKAASFVSIRPTAANVSYNGQPQVLLTDDGSATGGTMQYSLDGINWSTDIPTAKDAGDYTVRYKVVGDSNHNDTTPASIAVTIARKDVTVTADDAGKYYNEVDPLFNFTAVGLEGSDSLIGMLTRETGEDVGTYTILQGTLTNEENPNYNISFVNGTFTINPAVASDVTVPTATAVYGEKLSTATFSDSSWKWVNGDIIPNPGGNYAAYIEVDDSTYDYRNIDGYDAEFHRVVRNVSVVLSQVALTITAKDYTIKVDGALPEYGYDVAGLVNGDSLPVVVTVSGSAIDSTTVGTYDITVSGDAETELYKITYVNGTLTITEKDTQMITAEDVTLTYGDTNGKVTAETDGDGEISYEVETGTDVISVDADGNITAIKAGTATVTINAAETAEYATATKTVTVTVNKAPYVPNLPSAIMNVAYNVETVGAVTLPSGWAWEEEDASKALTVEEEVIATAVYNAADKENYVAVTAEVTIIRSKNSSVVGGSGSGNAGGSAGGGSSYNPPYVPSNPNPTTAPTMAPEPTPTEAPEPTEAPKADDKDEAVDWEAVSDEIEAAKKGAAVTVDMNGTTEIPKDVFELIAGKDISVEFLLEDGLMWIVNGKDVDAKALKDINLAVTLESKDNPLTGIPTATVNKVAGERKSVKMQLAHSGEFGFDAVLSVGLEKKNAGMYANLFFFNPVTKALEFICADVIAEDGKAEFAFTHASDYLIVMSEESMEPVQEEEPDVTPEETLEPEVTETPEPTEEPKLTEAPTPTVSPKPTEAPTPTVSPKPTASPTPTMAPEPTLAPEADEKEESAEEPEKPVFMVYTVQRGDTLTKIAAKYGCTVKAIVEANKELIQNPDMILIGWELQIPQEKSEAEAEDEPDAILPEEKKTVVYVVKRGDTLWAISRQYGCTVKELMELNRGLIKDADMIGIGWELTVPEK